MHADEANQGVKMGDLLEHGRYAFDPSDHHGPTLYYAALPLAWLRGEYTLATLTETTLRLVPALAGTMAVLLLGVLARPLGTWPATAAAAFTAVSPPAVYYSRYFIQETLLVAFTLAVLACAQRWWRNGHVGWAIAAGVGMGFMQATKGNAILFLIAAAIAALGARVRPADSSRAGRHALLAVVAASLTAALFFASFGTHTAGVRDAFAALGHGWSRLGGETGHEKPWWYYLRLFSGFQAGGLQWEQRVFLALALGGFGVAAFGRTLFARDANASSPASKLLQGAAIYTVVVVTVMSLTPYKTPWHVVHFVPGLALLAAGALAAIGRLRRGLFVACAAGFFAVGSLFQQTWLANFLRPADTRNPYAYVHSSPDVLKFRALVETALNRHVDQPVRIISEEYWPLPWYLRGLPRIGYWATPPDDCDGALVIASSVQVDDVKRRLRGVYHESVLGLRPGFILVILKRESL